MPYFRLCAFSLMLASMLSGCAQWKSDPVEQRIVVIGDIHADIGVTRDVFRLAAATDEDDDWIGGNLIVVQLGDLIGRSYEDREVLDFVLELQDKAEVEGGKVYALIGNHEVFGARLEFRWVSPMAYAAFDNIPSLDLDHPSLADLPPDQRARGAALMPGGFYARELAKFPAVLQLGSTIFVHGGVTPVWAEYGIERINAEVSQWFSGETEQPLPARGMDPRNPDDSVMMSRHYSENVGEVECAMLDESLKILGAERMIVAHTVQESITARCDQKVWAVDVGMSRYYSGNMQILEIINDEVISVIQPDAE